MITRRLSEINEADLQQIIDNKTAEKKNLEFKRDLNAKKDSDKKEFLADVSSLANAIGGDLVIGIGCNSVSGEPETLDGITLSNADAEVLSLEQMIHSGIKPRIKVDSRAVPLSNGKYVIVMRISHSWNPPHMVIYQQDDRFYTRSTNGKHRMDVDELRSAFILSELQADKIRHFRIERISKVYANDAFYPLQQQTGNLVFHIIPFSAFNQGPGFPFEALKHYKTIIKPMRAGGWDHMYNLDGLMGFSFEHSYVEVFKNGIIEVVDPTVLAPFLSNTERAVPADVLEESILEAYSNYMTLYQKLNVDGPFAICLSLVNVKNYRFQATKVGPHSMAARSVNSREVLNLPESIAQDNTTPGYVILKPIFDTLWNAFGHEKSANYGADGRRIR